MTASKIFNEDNDNIFRPIIKCRAIHRKNNVHKAIRKRKIATKIYKTSYYDNLHQYSKNKIHCSCPLCAFNHKKNGYVNYPISDIRRISSMNYQLIDLDGAI